MLVGVGFHKTGTTSLSHALSILGYRTKDITPRALIPVLNENYAKVIRIIKNYDALCDHPWFMIYKELDQLFPGSKFILTIREEESWYRSLSRHIGDLKRAQLEWVYGRGKGLPKDHKEHVINTYRAHNEEVMRYFKDRPSDLLVLDFGNGDGWKEICNFLDKEIPDVAFPKSNKAEDNQRSELSWRMKFRFFRHRLKNLLTIKYIDWRGLW